MIGDVKIRIDADIDKYNRKLERASNKMKGFESGVLHTSAAIAGGFAAATVAVTAGIGVVVGQAAKFQTAFTGLRKTTDATEEQFKKLEKGIIDMSRAVPASASEIADVAAVAGQLGIKAGDVLKFTRTMVDMGEATNLSSEEAAKSLARFANIMDMPMDQIDNLASTVVDLGNNFATSEKEIVNMGLRIAGAGKVVGFTESEVMSLATAMSSLGIRTESGGTAASRTLLKVNDAVINGGAEMDKYAKLAGVTNDRFKDLWKSSPADTFDAVVNGLGDMSREGKDVNSMLEVLGLGDIRVKDSLLRMAGAQGTFSEALKKGNDAWKKNSALQDEVKVRYADFANLLKMLRNRVMSVVLIIGKPLLKVLSSMLLALDPIMSAIEKLADKFYELDDSTKQTIAKFILAVPAILAVGTAVFGIIAGFSVLTATLALAGTSFMAVAGWTVIVVAALAVLVAATIGVVKATKHIIANWDDLSKKAGEVVESIRKPFADIYGFIVDPTLSASEKFTLIMETITNSMQAAGNKIAEISKKVGNYLFDLLPEPVQKVIESGVKLITDGFKKLEEMGVSVGGTLNALSGPLTALTLLLLGVSGPIGVAIGALVFLASKTTFLTDIMKVFKGEMEFSEAISNLGEMVIQFVEGLASMATIALEKGAEILGSLAKGLIDSLPMIIEVAGTIIETILNTITTLIPTILDVGVELILTIVEGVLTAIPMLLDAFTQIVEMVVSTLTENLPMLVDTFVDILTTLIETVVEMIPTIITAFLGLILAVVDVFIESLPKFIDAGMDILMALIDGFVEILPQLLETAIDALLALVDVVIELLPSLVEAGEKILHALIDGLVSVLPALVEAGLLLIGKLLVAIVKFVPKLLVAGTKLIFALVKGVLSILGSLVAAGLTLVVKLLGVVLSYVHELLSAGADLIESLVSGVLSKLGSLLSAGGELIGKLLTTIGDFIGDMLSKGAELIGSMIKGIGNKLSAVGTAATEIGGKVKETLTGFKDKLKSVGTNIIKGLISGISGMKDAAVEKVKDIGSSIKSTLTSFFSIKSPSRVMKKEVGVQIVAGLINGLDNQINPLVRMAQKVSEAAKPELPELDKFDLGDVRGHAKKITGQLSVSDERSRTNNEKGGINQTVNIHSNTPLSPSEAARKQKQASQRWALEMGF